MVTQRNRRETVTHLNNNTKKGKTLQPHFAIIYVI